MPALKRRIEVRNATKSSWPSPIAAISSWSSIPTKKSNHQVAAKRRTASHTDGTRVHAGPDGGGRRRWGRARRACAPGPRAASRQRNHVKKIATSLNTRIRPEKGNAIKNSSTVSTSCRHRHKTTTSNRHSNAPRSQNGVGRNNDRVGTAICDVDDTKFIPSHILFEGIDICSRVGSRCTEDHARIASRILISAFKDTAHITHALCWSWRKQWTPNKKHQKTKNQSISSINAKISQFRFIITIANHITTGPIPRRDKTAVLDREHKTTTHTHTNTKHLSNNRGHRHFDDAQKKHTGGRLSIVTLHTHLKMWFLK